MSDRGPSPRQVAAEKIAEWVRRNDLAELHGGEAKRAADRRSWTVGLSRLRLLDGAIQVFSPEYIVIDLQGPHAPPRSIYGSVEDALTFLDLLLIQRDGRAALDVPLRQPKRKKQ